MKIRTQYSIRTFTHVIKAFTRNNSWKQVGQSVSRYHYKHVNTTTWDKAKGDYVQSSVDFTYSNGFAPEYVSEAPNYMNYDTLSAYGNECYITNQVYNERY